MAVIRKPEEDPKEGRMYVSVAGSVVSVSRNFTALFGHTPDGITGRPLAEILPTMSFTTQLAQAPAIDDPAGPEAFATTAVARGGAEVPVSVTLATLGPPDVRLAVITLRRTQEDLPNVSLGPGWRLRAPNAPTERLLGADRAQLEAATLVDLLPEQLRGVAAAAAADGRGLEAVCGAVGAVVARSGASKSVRVCLERGRADADGAASHVARLLHASGGEFHVETVRTESARTVGGAYTACHGHLHSA